MAQRTQYANLHVVDVDDAQVAARPLDRIDLRATGSDDAYDESWLQALLLAHPTLLPLDEIDPSFAPLVPICRELNTPAGPVDAVFVNPNGMLTLVECKLWRNPQARREVVGQILDYAKELSHWTYEDLQREVSRVLGRSGNVPYELVRQHDPALDEARFVDDVTRNLRTGRVLLLIVGDGIREGVENIVEFMQSHSGLHFTLALTELAIHQLEGSRRIIQSRILARTAVINRSVVQLESDQMSISDFTLEEEGDQELEERRRFYREFWKELIERLRFDDVTQPLPNSLPQSTNLILQTPCGSDAWFSAFFSPSSRRIGVYLRFRPGSAAESIFPLLKDERGQIDEELGLENGTQLNWESRAGKPTISVARSYEDVLDPEHREEQLCWFADMMNRFVNAFRHRLADHMDELR
jgi:hypothetical protein